MIEAQVHCGLESPGVGFGWLARKGEVVPLDGHQRDKAADPVRGRGGVEARQDKEAGVDLAMLATLKDKLSGRVRSQNTR